MVHTRTEYRKHEGYGDVHWEMESEEERASNRSEMTCNINLYVWRETNEKV